MVKIDDVIACLREMAPEELAEPWDNCGLIVASEKEYTDCVIACLDVTAAVVKEAAERRAQLIVAHHPTIFAPIRRISRDGGTGDLLRALIRGEIAVYAAHTNVDKTYGGLNDLLAGIIGIATPVPDEADEPLSYFRTGELPQEMDSAAFDEHVRSRLKLQSVTVSAPSSASSPIRTPTHTAASSIPNTLTPASSAAPAPGSESLNASNKKIKKVVVMCGAYNLSAAQFGALRADALLCGEIKYHDALELIGMGVHIVQAGHHGTERFFMNLIGKWILDRFPDLRVHSVGFATPPMNVFIGGNDNGDV